MTTITGDIKSAKAEPILNISVYSRRKILLGGVREVISFDENAIVLITDDGELNVEGQGLVVGSLDTERGTVSAEGKIYAIYYRDDGGKNNDAPKKGLFGRLFG